MQQANVYTRVVYWLHDGIRSHDSYLLKAKKLINRYESFVAVKAAKEGFNQMSFYDYFSNRYNKTIAD
ncbi:hypothetical protein L596_011620 [Steinernema carpocapsae]|nr:hypothetical protein L596_011620 [Steinernema carpocapsae]